MIKRLFAEEIKTKPDMLHDYELINVTYDYERKTLIILAKKDKDGSSVNIQFENTIGFEAEMCDYWGPSPYIFDWSIKAGGEGKIYSRIDKEIKDNGYSVDNMDEYIEVCIVLSSGNQIRVLCESVLLDEQI